MADAMDRGRGVAQEAARVGRRFCLLSALGTRDGRRGPLVGARVGAEGALGGREGRGAHFRAHFPDSGALEGSHYIVLRQDGQTLNMTREPVHFTRVVPGQSLVADA